MVARRVCRRRLDGRGLDPVLEDQSVHAGGFGFRYLVARVLGIQTGIDVARGPEKWAFYVVFGSSW